MELSSQLPWACRRYSHTAQWMSARLRRSEARGPAHRL